MSDANRFANLGFEDFRRLAQDPELSRFERIGFPDAYRAGHEEAIFSDIRTKLTQLDSSARCVVDIGPGCSDLPRMVIDHCARMGHALHLVDSSEMLALLPDGPNVTKHAGRYPDLPALRNALRGTVDVIVCYSVLHYVFLDMPLHRFVDASLELLAPGGQMLIGDIPNVSRRKRFFSSERGRQFHRSFMQTDEDPPVTFNAIEPNQIDDAVMVGIVQRARLAGFDAFIVPQHPQLPMANRREDILVVRP